MAYSPFDLTGKVALITGGNSGIGLGMAHAIAQAGADVAIWGTNALKNAAARAELEKTGRKILALECDVGDEAAVEAAFARTLDAMGGWMAASPMPGSAPGGRCRFMNTTRNCGTRCCG